ncbi:MAG: c-type cytochrome [Candidatus Omnitrophica bacterium]|nr:c-type cytochrome [Candidatus Omnitrophota bacterium]
MKKIIKMIPMIVFGFVAMSPKLFAADSTGVTYPLGVDASVLQVPEDNPITPEKIELGKALYFDKRLSKDGTVSCASCHNPQKGYTDQQQFSDGIQRQKGGRNSPTVLNSGFSYFQFWDGRAGTLEAQAVGPMANPVEMGHTLEGVTESVKSFAGYKPLFKAAFGDEEINIDRIAKAIATFERSVLSGNSAWDRFVYGNDPTALSESAQRGLKLFEGEALCTRCHVGFTLSDSLFHNLGVGMNKEKPDLGRYEITKEEKDKGAFKTPTLRDLQRTAPYMHDGSVETLEEVVDLYDRGGEKNPWLDPKMQPLNLTPEQKADLLAFLRSLEGDWKPVEEPSMPQ